MKTETNIDKDSKKKTSSKAEAKTKTKAKAKVRKNKAGHIGRFEKIRHTIQFAWTIISNSYLIGFAKGRIYTGKLKAICVPGLNCYSCPGARGACPIGALQAVIGSSKYQFSFYVVGIIMMFGAIMGRFVCGFLCPFGLLQDLLHKIPFPKKVKTFFGDKVLRFLKYVILAVFVILLPMFAVDVVGQASPYFCKYICPSGIFLGGIPLVASNPMLRDALGFLFTWKFVILAVTVLLSIIIYRPFCKYLCPLGALYGLCNPISLTGLRLDKEKCVGCGKCAKVCQMGVDPVKNPNSMECIRCGKCIDNCPTHALSFGFRFKKTGPAAGSVNSVGNANAAGSADKASAGKAQDFIQTKGFGKAPFTPIKNTVGNVGVKHFATTVEGAAKCKGNCKISDKNKDN